MSDSYNLQDLTCKDQWIGSAIDGKFFLRQPLRRKILIFILEDIKAVWITYDFRVNLPQAPYFNDSNSGNSSEYTCFRGPIINATDSNFDCVVYDSAGSSSSTLNPGQLNIINNVKGDETANSFRAQILV